MNRSPNKVLAVCLLSVLENGLHATERQVLRGHVPAAAVQYGPDNGTFVYVVKADNTVELRNVTVGAQQRDVVAIQSGLAAGEKVVIDGVDKLQAGSTVVLRVSGATQPSTRGAAATRPSGGRHGQDGNPPQSDNAATRNSP